MTTNRWPDITSEGGPATGDTRSAVLVVGVYGASDAAHIRKVMSATSSSNGYRVVQRWAAAGVAPPDADIATATCAYGPPHVPRIQLFNDMVAKSNLREFDYVVIVDDRAILPDFFLDRFLDVQSALGFSVAQPARATGSSHCSTEGFGSAARSAVWSEIGTFVSIHRSMFGAVFPLESHTVLGWVDEPSGNGWKRGIIDASALGANPREMAPVAAPPPAAPVPAGEMSLNERVPRRIAAADLRALLDEEAAAAGRPCCVVDWSSGLKLAESIREHIVFSPLAAPPAALPYFGKSADVVVLATFDGNTIREAERVARTAVVVHTGASTMSIWPLSPSPRKCAPSVSILIPTYNGAALVDGCLSSMLPDLPPFVELEILVIDDGSTDVTAALVESWTRLDSRIRLLASNGSNEGFVRACNRGAAAARGDILVLLNNDTMPRPGWLQALIRTLTEHPNAGAVGGKLLYPDGRLQEAGSFIFSDGSAANFGRNGEDHAAPEYSYLREVDYCSAALLATRRDLYTRLGGLDERYVPAYYEDADYCMKVRAAGLQVYYQPASVVAHIEGASSGTSLDAGVKRYQQLNEVKFREKWRDALADHAVRPDSFDRASLCRLSRRRREGRQALVCSPVLPEFDREAGSLRVYSHIDALQAAGWTVVFAAEQGDPASRYARGLEQRGVETHCGFARLDELLASGRFDVALLAFWYVAEELIPRVRRLSPRTRILVDTIDLHFLRTGREILPLWDPRTAPSPDPAHADTMRRELAAYREADAVLTVSTKEASLVHDLVAGSTALVAPDGEDLPRSTAPWNQRRGIVFLGNFRHPPNVDAAAWLCRELLPLVPASILERHPVYIVGNELNDEIRSFAAGLRHVVMVGWVPSIFTYLSFSRLMVAPLRHGAGTKRKVVQALLAGLPTVATSIAIEGLPVRGGEHLLVADDAHSFVDCITRLVADDVLSQTLSDHGRAVMQERHDRRTSRAALIAAVDTALAASSRSCARETC